MRGDVAQLRADVLAALAASAGEQADLKAALAQVKPDLCSINTYSDSHAEFAIAAMEAGAHVFLEKPMATTVEDALRVVSILCLFTIPYVISISHQCISTMV